MEQTMFRNVGTENTEARGESPRRKNTFTTRRKFEIEKILFGFRNQLRDKVGWVDVK